MVDRLDEAISRRQLLKGAVAAVIALPSLAALLAACNSAASTLTPTTGPTLAPGATATPTSAATQAAASANLFDTMPTATQTYWLKTLYPAFQAKYAADTIVETDGGVENATMLRALVSANNSASPDMAWMESGEMGVYAAANLLADVDTWLTNNPTIKSDIFPALVKLCTYQGKVQSLPWMTNNCAVLINTDAFNAAGVAIPSQDPNSTWTWEDFQSACQAVTQKAGMKGWLANGTSAGWDAWLFHAWLATAGGTFLSDTGDPMFAGAEGLETMTFLQGLVKAGYTAELDTGYDLTLWFQKKAAMVINGPWNLPDLQKFTGFKFTVVPFPRHKQPATNIGGDNLFIFKHSADRQQVSFDYAKYMLSTDFQVKFNIESGNLPVTQSATNDPAYQTQLTTYPYLKGWVNSVPFGVARSSLPISSDAQTAFGQKAWDPIMLKGANVQSALKDAAAAVTALKNS